ncbi:MAG: cytochrome P450 [Actinocatenispora sp.]
MTQLAFPFDSPPERDDEPLHARLRREDPVPRVRLASGGDAYLASRAVDVRRIFVDRVFSRAAATRPGAVTLRPARLSPHVLVSMDPPDHTRLRGLVNRAFTPRTVERMRPAVQLMTDRLIDDMLAVGPPADFVGMFALPLPAMALAAMLGVPEEDHLRLRSWMDVMMSITAYTPGQMRSASRQMLVYLAHLAAAKRAEPGDDLLSGLISARDGENRLSESELLHTALIILTGGYETTAMLLANSVLTLDRHAEQWELMRRDPDAIPAAVEELLRYTRISRASLERVATEDVELSGVTVPAGSTVIGLKYSAHRDEELIDDPDRFDITRSHVPHMAFGLGVHHCIGASLARLELTVAYETLARRMPGLRPAVPDTDLPWKRGLITRGPEKLPVTW